MFHWHGLQVKLLEFMAAFSIFVVGSAFSRPTCSHIPPAVQEVVTGVPLDYSIPRSSLFKRYAKDETSLRISLYYHDSVDELPNRTSLFIKEKLVPYARDFWQRALFVRYPAKTPIRLTRKCVNNQYYFDSIRGTQQCSGPCRTETKCGEVTVPDDHLQQCHFCSSPNILSCAVAGPKDGPGVSDADFVLYVSTVQSERCTVKDTVAYAAHCQQEATFDRPIAGHVNICPNAISTRPHDLEVLFSTLRHEILHALGFSAALFAFYRDDNGRPLTERNDHGKPLNLDNDGRYYKWDVSTVQTVNRTKWWTRNGYTAHSVDILVTPRVKEEARRHFNCSQLEGAELENQGLDGTALTHWEKRVYENEAMTGTHTQNPVYSRLTLALMEDTGWYWANYAVAELLHWGKNLGCEFAMKSCAEWIDNRRKEKADASLSPFCDAVKGKTVQNSVTTCTDGRDAVALCNLVEYNAPLLPEYQNFLHIANIKDSDVPKYGGSVELADFCPYNQEFEWKSEDTPNFKLRDSRCEIEQNTPDGLANGALETYGPQSKCFNHKDAWTQKKCNFVRTLTHYGAGCYQYFCRDKLLWLSVLNETTFPCSREGQLIHVRQIVSGWLHEGTIVCPSCEDFCQSCKESDANARDMFGDPKVSVPCAALRIQQHQYLIHVILIVACDIAFYSV